MSFDTTASRFFRPSDPARLRRNQRRIQVQRLLIILRNVAVIAIVAVGAFAAYRHTQSNARFAVRSIEIEGAVHTPRASIDHVTNRYIGLNLFQIDIARVQNDLGGLGWVQRIDIEKKLPGRAAHQDHRAFAGRAGAQRRSSALHRSGRPRVRRALHGRGRRRSADHHRGQRRRARAHRGAAACIARVRSRALFARVRGLADPAARASRCIDRALGAVVYANADDIVAKWRNLYSVLAAENNPKIEYADLRFADRVIVKSNEVIPALSVAKGKDLETTNAQN